MAIKLLTQLSGGTENLSTFGSVNAVNISGGTIFENGNSLGVTYLGINDNAVSATSANNSACLGGIAASNYIRRDISQTMNCDLTLGSTSKLTDTKFRVLTSDTNISCIAAYGDNQGSGKIFVGQNGNYGGGIMYDGDDNPAMAGTADHVSFFRTQGGSDTEVFRYCFADNNVCFVGNIQGSCFTGNASCSTNASCLGGVTSSNYLRSNAVGTHSAAIKFTGAGVGSGICFNSTTISTDGAGIRQIGALNDGCLEIWTSDDDTEPIAFNHYTTGTDGSGTVTNWARINNSGICSFVGCVRAPVVCSTSVLAGSCVRASKIVGIDDGTPDVFFDMTDANPTLGGKTFGGEFIFQGDKAIGNSLICVGGVYGTQLLYSPTVCATLGACIGGVGVVNAPGRLGLLGINTPAGSAWGGVQTNFLDNTLWSLMGNTTKFGLYDDTRNEWAWCYTVNGGTVFFYNGTERFTVSSDGSFTNGIDCASSCHKSPVVCATTCMRSDAIFGSTCVRTGTLVATSVCPPAGTTTLILKHFTNECILRAFADSCTLLYHNNSAKIKTVSNGMCVCGCGFATNFISSSDCRLKENIESIDDPIELTMGLCGVKYNRKDGDNKDELHYGFVAQDVEKVIPDLVVDNEIIFNEKEDDLSETDLLYKELGIKNLKGIKYENLIPILVEAFKKQNNEINQLKIDIEKLKQK